MELTRGWVGAALIGGVLCVTGCGTSDKAAMSDSNIAELAAPRVPTEQPLHSYRKIYSVESHGSIVEKKHVGYLHHMTSESDRDGKFFVRDLKHDVRGFLLPEGKAFLYNPQWAEDTYRDLGNTGFQSGVKRILEMTGEVQFGPLDGTSSSSEPTAPGE